MRQRKPRAPDPEIWDESLVFAVRSRLGLSQRAFGAIIGADQRMVSAWERGKPYPTRSARRLIRLLDKRPDIVPDLQAMGQEATE